MILDTLKALLDVGVVRSGIQPENTTWLRHDNTRKLCFMGLGHYLLNTHEVCREQEVCEWVNVLEDLLDSKILEEARKWESERKVGDLEEVD